MLNHKEHIENANETAIGNGIGRDEVCLVSTDIDTCAFVPSLFPLWLKKLEIIKFKNMNTVMRLFFIFHFSFFIFNSSFAQTTFNICSGEIVYLEMQGTPRGNIQWQDSLPGGAWANIGGATGMNYNEVVNVKKYFRSKLTEGTCNPIYSPIYEVLMKICDIDGNVYTTVNIGSQVWMKENLKTTRLNDGTTIPLVTDNTAWSNLLTSGRCYYNNDSLTYKNVYGGFYSWYTVNTLKLCPTGFHVPNDAEWTTLSTFLGGNAVAGGKLKEIGTTHWSSSGGTDEYGFTALPGSLRQYLDGTFAGITTYGYWWSATGYDAQNAYGWSIAYNNTWIDKLTYYMNFGFSVRCLKD